MATKHISGRHEYEVFEGASGMVCTAMVQDIRGDGDSCGLSASHPIHIQRGEGVRS